MNVGAAFKADMAIVREAAKIVIGDPASGVPITPRITDRTTTGFMGSVSSLETHLFAGNVIEVIVDVLPAVEEGLARKDVGVLKNATEIAPLFLLPFIEYPEVFDAYKVPRTGGKEAQPEQGNIRTLKTLIDTRLAGQCSEILYSEMVSVLPAPVQRELYVPNFSVLAMPNKGEYVATLVVNDRLVSNVPFFCPPDRYTPLMDYSDSDDHHFLEARATIQMEQIEQMAAYANPRFDTFVIIFEPVKPPKSIFIKEFGRDRHSFEDAVSERMRAPLSFDGLISRPRVDISDAKVDTGAASGFSSTTMERVADTSRPGLVLLVRTVCFVVSELLIDAAAKNIRGILEKIEKGEI